MPAADSVVGGWGGFRRCARTLAASGERTSGLLLDAIASLGAMVLAVVALTRDQLVRIPVRSTLTDDQAKLFENLLYRVIVMVLFVAALLLATRVVKRLLRMKDVLAR